MTISVSRTAALTVTAALALTAPSAVAATSEQLHEQDAYPGLAAQAPEPAGPAPPQEGSGYRFAGAVSADDQPGDAGQAAAQAGDDGLDWGSAAIGAGMGIALALVALTAALAVTRARAPNPTT
jgi:hypothetical protein